MDEASKLVTELQSKLAELDHKVWKYRRDMASEFEKYAEGLLRDVPKDVSETVSKAIAESMKDYKSLNPDATSASESGATGNSILSNGIGVDRSAQSGTSTITIPYRMSEDAEESPRSPHEREKEFQGLFTPSYLPLLESNNRNERRSSYDPLIPPPLPNKSKEMDILHVDASTDTRSLAPSPDLIRPPTPKRRNTDEASITSDLSDGPVRRSALRRLSSSSKGHSPRRVRFDVAGEEVLPTSSPLLAESVLGTDIPPSSMGKNSDEETESEQVEDIDEQPPPKRISSSQALRALSRGPLDNDGTTWTTVSAPPDGSPSVATANGSSADSSIEAFQPMGGFNQLGSGENRGSAEALGGISGSHQTAVIGENHSEDKDPEETPSDDDEMLDMPALRSRKGQISSASPSILSPVNPTNIGDNKSPTASTRSPSTTWQTLERFEGQDDKDSGEGMQFNEDDHDELFHFDENNERSSTEQPQEDSDETESPTYPAGMADRVNLSIYSQSPARQIAKPVSPKPADQPATGSVRAVIGSYKGHPFNMPIVSDEIHAQAASLGAMNSFVGSVNGRSGIDESDVQSFRASGGVGSFSGTPRSMSERMMMDDLIEAEESKNN